ncbi:GNAT family N-acetyltransferase [Luteolibacter soli]|uniref:GNAT family N-acetyltransferase n=1 Tax=Luteolibacter soli TaxID=3135280 RepID=A0ABU9ATX7_9BACT
MAPPPKKSRPKLMLPSARFQRSFIAAMEEFAAEGRCGDDSMIGKDMERFGPSWRTPEGFAAFLAKLAAVRHTPPHEKFVCSTTWWWTEGDEFIGRIAVRHELNARLLEAGGHIGYDVRRSRRREGHATRMLAAVLPKARKLGIGRVLITCHPENVASRRVIEANGGVFEDQRADLLRFWIPEG